jgi:catechol-2,3-dioxygenase
MTTSAAADAGSARQDRPAIRFDIVVLDTDDITGLAEFYCNLLGWRIEDADDSWITIGRGAGARMAFQLAPDHQRPTWPEPGVPQQCHLDFRVSDMEVTAAFAESIGARRVDTQQTFTVLLDPSGHPFCLCLD